MIPKIPAVANASPITIDYSKEDKINEGESVYIRTTTHLIIFADNI